MIFTKRRKFILASVILSLGLLMTQLVNQDWRYLVIAGVSVVAGLLTIWSLYGDLKKLGWFMAPILPVVYPASVALFYFLLPERFLTRAIVLILFGIGMYAIFLTENIFIVAALRTIQLARAALAVGFLFTLLTAFFLLDTIFSFKLNPWWNALFILVGSFPLFLHGVWMADLDEPVCKRLFLMAGTLAFALAQLGMIMSFWPVSIAVVSLFLVTAIYVGLGLTQHYLSDRLFSQTIREYAQVGIIVLAVTFLAARWGG